MSLNINTLQLKSTLDGAGLDESIKKRILSTALALAVARIVMLPSSPVDSFTEFYKSQPRAEIENLIYQFNEQLIVDVDLAATLARNYWYVRYKTLYPILDNGVYVSGEYDLFCKLSCVDLHISLEDYNFCNANKVILTTLINNITNLLIPKNN